MKAYLKLAIMCCLLLIPLLKGAAQQVININDISKGLPKSVSNQNDSRFQKTVRYRLFNFNSRLRTISSVNKGEVLLLDLFEDKQYKAIVENVAEYGGVQTITARIDNENHAFCYISISNRGISMKLEVPDKDEEFIVGADNGITYLQQYKMSDLQKEEIDCGSQEFVPSSERMLTDIDNLRNVDLRLEDPVTINLLIAYTPAAKKWANENKSTNGIDNLIASVMSISNQVLANSKTGITLNLVHKYETNYKEVNTASIDLRNFRDDNDGYMDEVHALKKQYSADLIMLLCDITWAGGQAYLLKKEAGDPLGGVSIVRVQQAASYSSVHEMGHNMGCHHHKSSEGPGLYSYSAGYRAVNSKGVRFSTVMPNPKGTDGLNYPRIAYFSSPDVIVDGVPVGNVVDANNGLTLKKIKHTISKYRDYFGTGTTLPPTINIGSPLNNSTVTSSSLNVIVTATASTGNTINKVEFYLNGVLKTTKTTLPYTAIVGTLNSGSNIIKAKVTDSKGQSTETAVNVTYTNSVGGGANCSGVLAWDSKKAYNGGDKVHYNGYIYTAAHWTQNNRPDLNYGQYGKPWKDNRVLCDDKPVNIPPSISINNPTDGITVNTNTINVATLATATNATIAKVDFYLNGTLKATKTTSPYSASISTLKVGSNSIMAKVTDSKNLTAESTININYSSSEGGDKEAPSKVENLRSTASTYNSIDLQWDASTDNVGVTFYRVFDADTDQRIIGIGSLKYTVKDLKPNTTYRFYVRAIDAAVNLSEKSDIISVKTQNDGVNNIPPSISIYSPTNNAVVTNGSVNVMVNASAATGNSISKVEFYLNDMLTATKNAAPYTTEISSLNLGSNNIKVKVYDNKGQTGESTVNITFNQPTSNNCMGIPEWISTKSYNGGDLVKEGDIIYKANHWTQNNRPSQNFGAGKPWSIVSRCDGSTDIGIQGETQTCNGVKVLVWNKETIYDKLDTRVVYNNSIYTNKYWTQGNIPSNGGAWTLIGSCR